MREKMLDLLGQSVIISGFIAIALVATTCYLWGRQMPVEPELLVVLSAVISYFFGARTQRNARLAK